MISLGIKLQEPLWPDLQARYRAGDVLTGEHLEVGGLAAGMVSGAPSVAIRVDLPEGKVAIAETSLALFLQAADALKARFGDPREGRP